MGDLIQLIGWVTGDPDKATNVLWLIAVIVVVAAAGWIANRVAPAEDDDPEKSDDR